MEYLFVPVLVSFMGGKPASVRPFSLSRSSIAFFDTRAEAVEFLKTKKSMTNVDNRFGIVKLVKEAPDVAILTDSASV